MQTALTLLISAMQLLAMASGNPNLPTSFKEQAITIANQAIVVAKEELAKSSTTNITVPDVQPLPIQPVYVGTTQVVPQVIQQVNPQIINQTNNIKNMEIIVKNDSTGEVINGTYNTDISLGSLVLKVDYKIDGISTLETISMSSDDGQNRTMNKDERACGQSQVGGKRDDCSANFLLKLLSKGQKNVTFTVGDTTKTIVINVQ